MKGFLGLAFLLGFFFPRAICDYLLPRSRLFHREEVHWIQFVFLRGNVAWGWFSPHGSFSPWQNKLAFFDKNVHQIKIVPQGDDSLDSIHFSSRQNKLAYSLEMFLGPKLLDKEIVH
jgi:hypothetical protein